MQIDRIHITQGDTKEQIQQIRMYLFKLVEQLEEILSRMEDQLAIQQKGDSNDKN